MVKCTDNGPLSVISFKGLLDQTSRRTLRSYSDQEGNGTHVGGGRCGEASVPVVEATPELRPCHSEAAVPSTSADYVSMRKYGSFGQQDLQAENAISRQFSQESQPGIQPADPGECYHADVQAVVIRATDTLQNAYDKLFKKYQQLKTKQFAEVEERFDSQSRLIEGFSAADEELRQQLHSRSSVEEHDGLKIRAREMEAACIEYQNELALERAKSLELRQELASSRLHESKMFGESGMLRKLMGNLTQLTISSDGKSGIIFCHDKSGFSFKLEQNKFSEEVGGKDALLYTAMSPEKLPDSAPKWMHSEIVFDMSQAHVFFRRILAAAIAVMPHSRN